MLRQRRSRILATLGPFSSSYERIHMLAKAGADVFRLNFSHGGHDEHAARYHAIRAVEREIDAHRCAECIRCPSRKRRPWPGRGRMW